MTDTDLFRVRIALVQAFLRANNLDGILLSRTDNFAMATGGKRNYVNCSSDLGACALFITKDGRADFVGTNIEAPRVMEEELAELGCGEHQFLWFDGSAADAVRKHFSGAIASDDGSVGANVHTNLAYLRALLTPAEIEKYKILGSLAADAMTSTLAAIQPGMTEADIAAALIAEGAKRRCLVPVCLVAADERIAKFRHPLPTQMPLLSATNSEREVKSYVMVVGGFVREGLVVSITRFKQVADVPSTITDAYNRICAVDAVTQEACVPGKTLGEVFATCQDAYRRLGFSPTEWHNHHQGGMTGYGSRTVRATPGASIPILDESWRSRVREITAIDTPFGHAFAWNPSAPDVKSEDTFVLAAEGTKQIVTLTPALPSVDLESALGRPTPVVKSAMAPTIN